MANLRFEDLTVHVPRQSNISPIEITLFEGIRPNMKASAVPYAHPADKISDGPGLTFVGYPLEIEGPDLKMTPDRIEQGGTKMGGWHIHKDAIYSMRELEYKV